MDKVKIEAFLSTPATALDGRVSRLIEEIEDEFGDKVQVTIFGKDDELFKEYNLTMTPAVVIGEMIKMMGFCPSKESFLSALCDMGLKYQKG